MKTYTQLIEELVEAMGGTRYEQSGRSSTSSPADYGPFASQHPDYKPKYTWPGQLPPRTGFGTQLTPAELPPKPPISSGAERMNREMKQKRKAMSDPMGPHGLGYNKGPAVIGGTPLITGSGKFSKKGIIKKILKSKTMDGTPVLSVIPNAFRKSDEFMQRMVADTKRKNAINIRKRMRQSKAKIDARNKYLNTQSDVVGGVDGPLRRVPKTNLPPTKTNLPPKRQIATAQRSGGTHPKP